MRWAMLQPYERRAEAYAGPTTEPAFEKSEATTGHAKNLAGGVGRPSGIASHLREPS